MDIEENKGFLYVCEGVLTQEVEDEEHCQEQQCDDGTAHGICSR